MGRPDDRWKSLHAIRAERSSNAYAEDFASGFALEREEIFNLIGTPTSRDGHGLLREARTDYTEGGRGRGLRHRKRPAFSEATPSGAWATDDVE